MKGDFTRDTFKPERHYQQVLMQQGRVQLDADWNEQAAIGARRDETTAADIIGHCGGPADNAAFAILTTPPAGQPAPDPGDFYLSAGRYYVDGIQCEIEKEILFTAQPDRRGVTALANNTSYLIYLDVWRRHVTFHENKEIRESALGGPDTATRLKTVWQVHAAPLDSPLDPNLPPPDPCHENASEFQQRNRPALPRLAAKALEATPDTDPCVLPTTAGYRGLENQLYRVEIHAPGGLGAATFKWSRENGSVATRITNNVEVVVGGANTNRLTVASTGLDTHLGFAEDDIVEIIHETEELQEIPGALARVANVDDSTREITLKAFDTTAMPISVNLLANPRLRRWEGVVGAAVDLTVNNGFIALENGIEILFDLPTGAEFRTGDYWQIPARSASPDAQSGAIEWPITSGIPDFLPPKGITHHFCRLGVVSVTGGAVTLISDCRCLWPALTAVPRLFYVSGDGQEVMPVPTLVPTVAGRFKLSKPLVVGINNGRCQPPDTRVRFSVLSPGTGWVVATGGTPAQDFVDVLLDPNGLARCDFYLDGTNPVQQVRASLLDAQGHETSLPIIFTANLSIASQVSYAPPADCAGLSGVLTVAQALDRLRQQVSLYPVTQTHIWLAAGQNTVPLTVLAANRCGPVGGVPVSFVVLSGPDATVTPTTIGTQATGQATATCQLQPQAQNAVVLASIVPSAPFPAEPKQVFFAIERNFQGAIDPGVRIKGVFWQSVNGASPPLLNDVPVPTRFLAGGIRLELETQQIPLGVKDKPTCFVTLEMPFPFDGVHGSFWGSTTLGYESLRLEATANSDNGLIVWNPSKVVQTWLTDGLPKKMRWNDVGGRLLARLTLKGNFIWVGDNPQTYLDGDTFGAVNESQPTKVILSSGDDRRGGDFEMWFWLIPDTPLLITRQPVSITVRAGDDAPFTVEVSPSAGVRFQWLKTGVPIQGATEANFTIHNAQLPDSGVFSVVVENETGSVTSSEAILRVLPNVKGPEKGIDKGFEKGKEGEGKTLDKGLEGVVGPAGEAERPTSGGSRRARRTKPKKPSARAFIVPEERPATTLDLGEANP